MKIKFVGGPYDGKEAEHTAINQHASILNVHADLGLRAFALMPPPESWDKLLRGERAETNPIYPYERVLTPEGPRLQWPQPGDFDQALLEAKLKIHPRARTALSTLSNEVRRSIVQAVAELQRFSPDEWPKQKAVRIAGDEPVYLVHLSGELQAFVRVLDTNELELFDIVREDTLRQFVQRYGKVGVAG